MKDKLRDLLESEGLKPCQFAEMLGINPAGVSHILAGRNKPGFELLQKILRRFPRVSPDWLLIDQGPMYRSDAADAEPAIAASAPMTSPIASSPSASLFEALPEQTPATAVARSTASLPTATKSGAQVSRVVIFYEDQTFESYTPSK